MFRQKYIVAAFAAAYASAIPSITLAVDNQEQALPEVQVTSKAPVKTPPGALRDEIIKTESVTSRDIERSNAGNVPEALDKRPGVSLQVECSVCNTRNINLNNMPGRFTTLLIDGIPLYSSVSNAYGLDSVNVQGVERIDVSRGAGTSLIAPEALAGTVNIVTKRPVKEEYILRGQAGSFGFKAGDAYLAKPFDGGALALSLDARQHDSVDQTGSGISQYTGYDRQLIGLGYFLDDVGGFKVRGRLDSANEHRGGGPLGNDYAAIKANTTGNPFNFSAGVGGSPYVNGWVDPNTGTLNDGGAGYNGGQAGLAQIIFTTRNQGTLIGERETSDGKLRLAAGYAEHHQDSFYGADGTYVATQKQSYLESSYQHIEGQQIVTVGADYRYEDLNSNGVSFATGAINNGVDNYAYRVPGIFTQLYRPMLDGKVELNASLRADKHNVFGTIYSPRLNVLYHHDDAYASRFSVGEGFRAPTSFFEQNHGVIADSRIVRQIDKPETSDNASYALSYAADRVNWTTSANFNRIKNMATLLTGQPIAGSTLTETIFTSTPDPVIFRTLDWVGNYQWTPATVLTLGLEKSSYTFTPGALNFSRPEERAYLTLDSTQGSWDWLMRWSWTGKQNLAKFYNYAADQQYNLDGTKKPDWSPSFSVVDLHGEYHLTQRYSAFFGVDNLTDYRQSSVDSFLLVHGSTGSIDTIHIWGPQIGRTVFMGLKAEL